MKFYILIYPLGTFSQEILGLLTFELWRDGDNKLRAKQNVTRRYVGCEWNTMQWVACMIGFMITCCCFWHSIEPTRPEMYLMETRRPTTSRTNNDSQWARKSKSPWNSESLSPDMHPRESIHIELENQISQHVLDGKHVCMDSMDTKWFPACHK